MDRKLLFALLLLPGLAHAVICKTVGPDGVISFTNLPGSECPSGEAVETYLPPATAPERAQRLVEGAPGSEAAFAGYESIKIESPEDGGVVRTNVGTVPVVVALQPGLQQFHFITVYLNGEATQGPYGSSEVVLTNLDRGTYRLYVTVKDSKGKSLIKSDVISFTVQRVSTGLTVNPITGDDYVDQYDPGSVNIFGCYECEKSQLSRPGWVTLWFPTGDLESKAVEILVEPETVTREIMTAEGPKTIIETYNWVIEVPREILQSEASFEARVRPAPDTDDSIPITSRTTSTHSVDPAVSTAFSGATEPADYRKAYPEIFTTPGRVNPAFPGISTTPGQTNPAFTPKFTP